MRIVPVIDLKGGLAVHGVAGERDRYRAVRSVLADSADPLALAAAFRERLGLDDLYLADLDAIEGRGEPSLGLYRRLVEGGHRLAVDAGVRDAGAAEAVAASGVADVVVALETLARAEDLAEVVERLGPRRVVFSVDLRGGVALGGPPAWRGLDGAAIARAAVALGVRRLLLLDIAAVGTGSGCPVLALVEELAADEPRPEIIAGGGVRHAGDLGELARAGADAALVATALHGGAIGAEEIRGLRPGSAL